MSSNIDKWRLYTVIISVTVNLSQVSLSLLSKFTVSVLVKILTLSLFFIAFVVIITTC